MELFYNPHLMPPGNIKQTFVARQWLVDEVVELTQRQPEGAGVQHVVIIGPRGMGKTTVLLMIALSMQERGIGGWQAIRLREEPYAITDLVDFWLEVLQELSAETHDMGLLERTDRLKKEHQTGDELHAAAFALIKDWAARHGKRILLLVDSLDMILSQINEERDNARLRNLLMNDGTVMFVGAATSYFREARAYDQPLYNFFKIYNLESLKSVEIEELLRRRAALDGRADFEETLRANASRLRALEYFTGGNPRLTLMLYRVVTGAGLAEVYSSLEKLLDEVTPYFKGKIESLPTQQRKILDHVARLSSSTREGLTPAAIAEAARLSPNQVSAQLKRLAQDGYVRAANLRGRHSFYALSEPLLAVWYQMRFSRDARQRVQWLVDFLREFYGAEAGERARELEVRFPDLIARGQFTEVVETMEHRCYLAAATGDPLSFKRIETDFSLLETEMGHCRQTQLAANLLAAKWAMRGYALLSERRHSEALDSFDRAAGHAPGMEWVELVAMGRFFALSHLGRFEEAWRAWRQVGQLGQGDQNWRALVSIVLLALTGTAPPALHRALISDAGLDEPLFPLARALDYVITGDEALIEKLSPEVRGIVEQLVTKLRASEKRRPPQPPVPPRQKRRTSRRVSRRLL